MILLDELTDVLINATYEELVEISKLLNYSEGFFKEFTNKPLLLENVEYWIRYESESAFDKIYYKGSGIPYIEILKKVSKILKLKLSSSPNVSEIEEKLLEFLLNNLPDDVKGEINSVKNEYLRSFGNSETMKNVTTDIVAKSSMQAVVSVGATLATQQAAKQAAIAVASGSSKALIKAFFAKGLVGITAQKAATQVALQSAARFGLLRTILSPIAGPLGIALLLGSIVQFALGESYSKIIPIVINIAVLRAAQEVQDEMVGI